MLRIIRVGLAMAALAAAGLVAYEMLRQAAARGRERLPERAETDFPQDRPPFAEASQYGAD